MIKRRDALKLTLAAAGAGLISKERALAQSVDLLKFLCPPDGTADLVTRPGPPSRLFVAPLNVMPIALLNPLPNGKAHQRYDESLPKKLYAPYGNRNPGPEGSQENCVLEGGRVYMRLSYYPAFRAPFPVSGVASVNEAGPYFLMGKRAST